MTTLYFTQNAWRQIEESVRKHRFVETGGILMGYPVADGSWVIAYASGPGPRAIHMPRAIQFDDAYTRRLIRKMKRRSGGLWQYVGDWHSHTVRRLTPSRGDKLTLMQKWQQARYTAPSPIMLIVGAHRDDQVQGRAYVWTDGLREVRRVAIIDREEARQLRGQTVGWQDGEH